MGGRPRNIPVDCTSTTKVACFLVGFLKLKAFKKQPTLVVLAEDGFRPTSGSHFVFWDPMMISNSIVEDEIKSIGKQQTGWIPEVVAFQSFFKRVNNIKTNQKHPRYRCRYCKPPIKPPCHAYQDFKGMSFGWLLGT